MFEQMYINLITVQVINKTTNYNNKMMIMIINSIMIMTITLTMIIINHCSA